MNVASTTASRWAVSTRTRGEVPTAGVSAGAVELVLLGVPADSTIAETEGWLHDLAGVALETSRGDTRVRAIPALLHHALSGLLFSQAELWSAAPPPGPCSAAFCETSEGAAFGWLGDADVRITADGEALAPQWVIVRDEQGHEARGLAFPDARALHLELDYWPGGRDAGEAPVAIEADWHEQGEPELTDAPASVAPAAVAEAEAPAEPAALVSEPLPEALPAQQPGLAGPARGESELERLEALAELSPMSDDAELNAESPSVAAASASEPGDEPESLSHAQAEALEDLAPPQAPHPVGRWLGRLMHWGRKSAGAAAAELPVAPASSAPVSAYDALLSERVPPTPLEQTALVLDAAEMQQSHGDDPASSAHVAGSVDASEPPSATVTADAASEIAPPAEASGHVANASASDASTQAAPSDASETTAAIEPASESVANAHVASSASVEPAEVESTSTHTELVASDAAQVGASMDAAIAQELAPAAAATPQPAASDAPNARVDEAASDAPSAHVDEAASDEPSARVDEAASAVAPAAGESAAEPAPEPSAHARAVAELAAADAATLPVLPSPPLEAREARDLSIEREPVGADAAFAIPRVPARDAAPAGPPVLRVPAAAAPPRLEPQASVPPPVPAAPEAPAPAELAPRALDVPSAPPMLRVSAATPPAAPPVLRVQVPGRAADAPPMLRVTPGVVPPAIVPTPPVAPLASEPTAFAPAEGASVATTPRAWPAHAMPVPPRRITRRTVWLAAGVVLGVFFVGWLLGTIANPDREGPGPVARALRAIGLGPAHYDASVNSSPNGAWIAVDGKDLDKRTPATVELSPGPHTLSLTLPDLGSAPVAVRGKAGERIAVNPSLDGALTIDAADPAVPIRVSLDGKALGYAPLQLESVAPGLHELQFTGPGMPAWGQTVQVGVRRTVQVVAHAMSAPSDGVIQLTATLNDERGASPLRGAQVYVDGELRATTPASLDLPRGPHSLRVEWKGESAPVQVIDLPGGNQRFATFAFGLESASPQVTLLAGVHPATRQQTAVVSASLAGLSASDVQEAWLHSKLPEGSWRRDAMTVMPGSGRPVVVGVFPGQAFDAQGQSRWYVSVTTRQGDELFSEMQQASLGAAAVPHHRTRHAAAAAAPETPQH